MNVLLAIASVAMTIGGVFDSKPVAEPVEPIVFEQKVSDEDLYNLVMITLAEAEGESELGQRLVIDTVLNRVENDDFPNTITEVIFQENQFSGTGDRWEKVTYSDAVEKIVKEELKDRTNKNVLYFRILYYGKYGEPLFKEGGHYFSGIDDTKNVIEETK